MKKIPMLVLVFMLTAGIAVSQTAELLIKGNNKEAYLDHKVAAKENFYSIARLYNVPPKEIAAFNKLDMDKGLNLGQTLRIPLTASNYSQTVNKGTPVYFKTGENAGLMKISEANKNVPLENLRRWNNLSSDRVTSGNKLIVGFLISPEMPAVAVTPKKEPVVTTKEPEKVAKEVTTVKTEPKKEDKPVQTQAVITKKLPVTITADTTTGQGYFHSSFNQQIRTAPASKKETLTAGIFKTASGWQDSKYYLLMDGLQPGRIVKIINPENNKVVYAKVLGEMSGIRQNEGLNIRISNSAASVLDISDTEKFILQINY